ncbi:Anthocyanidin 3-O-glucoside 2'''-O-xylosyltransferase [Bertholletia excelsa]
MEQRKYHIAMFPWFAFGHMTPFLHLSNELANRGHTISFLLPKKAQAQLQLSNLHPNLISFHTVTVPTVSGLPSGTETASDIPLSLNHLLITAMDQTRDQLEEILKPLKPDFVFYDFAHWIPQLGSKIGFKSINYIVVCVAAIAIAVVPALEICKDRPLPEKLVEPPPGYPSATVVFRRHEAARSLAFINGESGSGVTFYERIAAALKESDAIAVRTCQELEGRLCEYLHAQYGKPVHLTGPVLPESDKTPLEERWARWLSKFDPRSVVFCALGSQWVLEKEQFQELALGLELTGRPFLAAVKPPLGVATVEEALPEEFKERIKGRGEIYGGWVQQTQILNHPSIGCFVTHAGFGSMWEGLISEPGIVLLPHLGDQILNTRLLGDELKVGVEVERDENGRFWKEGVCLAIEKVMDEGGEVGRRVKKNHAKWRETLGSQGFMSGYIDKFIEKLHEL